MNVKAKLKTGKFNLHFDWQFSSDMKPFQSFLLNVFGLFVVGSIALFFEILVGHMMTKKKID